MKGKSLFFSLALFELAHQPLPYVIQGSFLASKETREDMFVVKAG